MDAKVFYRFLPGWWICRLEHFQRTGYPVFPLDPATTLNSGAPTQVPKRNMYPTDELTKNPVNYKKAVDEQYGGSEDVNKAPWWLQ